VTTDEQRKAFSEALRQALDDARMSGRSLARELKLAPASVSKWLRGKTTPPPETVARAERCLRVSPGTLSRPLGYVLVNELSDHGSSSVTEAVNSDQDLGPRERAVLLAVYRELVRQYGAAHGDSIEREG
jgi:transcriptional regulator with XRE-family HTH domain